MNLNRLESALGKVKQFVAAKHGLYAACVVGAVCGFLSPYTFIPSAVAGYIIGRHVIDRVAQTPQED